MLITVAIWLLTTVSTAPFAAEKATTTQLYSSITESSEGYFTLSWLSADSSDAELQVSPDSAFSAPRTYAIEAEGSMTLSGFPDGEWFFRAGTADNWSQVTQITVQHHSIVRAFSFFTLGLFLFLVLSFVIIKGRSQADLQEGADG